MQLIHKYYLLIILNLIIIIGAYLYFYAGQPFLCVCQDNNPIASFGKMASDSQSAFDWYSFAHLVYGTIAFAILSVFKNISVRLKLLLLVLSAGLIEILEHTEYVMMHFRTTTIATQYYGDAVINSIGDIAASILGFMLAVNTRLWLLVSLIIMAETASYIMIGDNLTLNILSFILPVEWVNLLYQ